jgi:hypothetical protein
MKPAHSSSGIKQAFEHYYATQGVQLAEAKTFSAVTGVTGAYIPVTISK